MQRYIYGNFKHLGYKIHSSDPNFFVKNGLQMNPLLDYDMATAHGDLPAGAHRSFWMLTTSLGIPGGKEYLFLQESGSEIGALVVQGYRSDTADGDLYGPAFEKLLRTRFDDSKAALHSGAAGKLAPVSVQDLPNRPLEPAKLPTEVLEKILLLLLEGKQVFLRLPSKGAEAMEDGKKYLLAIYQRLPYAVRKNTACLTGVTENQLTLAGSFGIVLADGDTAFAEDALPDDVIDLRPNAPQGELTTKEKARLGRLGVLCTMPQAELDAYFSFCREILGEKNASLGKYGALLEFSTLGAATPTGEDAARWARKLYDLPWTAEERERLCRKIGNAWQTEVLADALVAHLKAMLPEYKDLQQLGLLSDSDKEKTQTGPRDQHGALTLRMLEKLPEALQDAVGQRMQDHFVAAAKARCPDPQRPTKRTVAWLEALPIPREDADAPALANKWKARIAAELCAWREEGKRNYQQQRARQQQAGEDQIRKWAKDFPAVWLPQLDKKLEETYYLHEELWQTWRQCIAQEIGKVCHDRGASARLEAPDGTYNCCDPLWQQQIIPLLAAKAPNMGQTEVELLYIWGSSRQFLSRGADRDTSLGWRRAVDALWPELPELARPLQPKPAKKNPMQAILCTIVLVLTALAALWPTAVMAWTGAATAWAYGWVLGCLGVLAAASIVGSWLQKRSASRRFFRGLAIAAMPGIAAALGMLLRSLI